MDICTTIIISHLAAYVYTKLEKQHAEPINKTNPYKFFFSIDKSNGIQSIMKY